MIVVTQCANHSNTSWLFAKNYLLSQIVGKLVRIISGFVSETIAPYVNLDYFQLESIGSATKPRGVLGAFVRGLSHGDRVGEN